MNIAIADSNRDYARRLMEGLQQNNNLTVSIFTSAERLEKAINTERYDIVIFDPDLSEERMTMAGVKLPVCLYSNDETRNAALYKGVLTVQKYQRISRIYKEILHEFADKAGYSIDINNDEITKVIGVYSPIGGSGKTTISLTLASKLRNTGANVLFISGEQLDSSSFIHPHSQEEDGINLLIASINNQNVTFRLKLDAVVKKGYNGVDYIEGFDRIVDYESVTGDDITDVLSEIKNVSEYRYIVVDMESVLDKVNRTVFELADQIILVENPGELPEKKLEMFEKQPVYRDNIKKIVKVMNFADSKTREKYFSEVKSVGVIHSYGNLPLNNIIHNIDVNQEILIETFVF